MTTISVIVITHDVAFSLNKLYTNTCSFVNQKNRELGAAPYAAEKEGV